MIFIGNLYFIWKLFSTPRRTFIEHIFSHIHPTFLAVYNLETSTLLITILAIIYAHVPHSRKIIIANYVPCLQTLVENYMQKVLVRGEVFIFYVPPARKLVFRLQLRVAQCCALRYRGMKSKNWTAHVPIAIQWSTIFFLFFFFFFVQR